MKRSTAAASDPTVVPLRPRIVAEARRHFLAHGFRGVTMDDLAREMAMSKKTLYAFFESKTALIEAVIHDKLSHVDKDLGRITAAASNDCLGSLHSLLECVQAHMDEIRPSFLRDIRREAPDLFAIVERRRRDIVQKHFGRVFLEGRRAGLIRHDIPPKLAIEILLGAVQAVLNPVKLEELALTPKAGFTTVVKVVLEGVTTDRARQKPSQNRDHEI